jgi:hypothetical protein
MKEGAEVMTKAGKKGGKRKKGSKQKKGGKQRKRRQSTFIYFFFIE